MSWALTGAASSIAAASSKPIERSSAMARIS
jgi:hypothetical protein